MLRKTWFNVINFNVKAANDNYFRLLGVKWNYLNDKNLFFTEASEEILQNWLLLLLLRYLTLVKLNALDSKSLSYSQNF